MTVIAFRPRPTAGEPSTKADEGTPITGFFRSPSGRTGTMSGHLRLQRLVLVPRGVFVTGVFTGELRDVDGSLVGIDSRRCTVPADLRRDDDHGLEAVVRPVRVDLMGIEVDVATFAVAPSIPLPSAPTRPSRRRRPVTHVMTRTQPR